jgi:hypothetical protein
MKMTLLSRLHRIMAALLLLIATTPPALAYIDPVTGSFLLQGAIGAIAAILASIRSVRVKIAEFFTSRRKDLQEPDNEPK